MKTACIKNTIVHKAGINGWALHLAAAAMVLSIFTGYIIYAPKAQSSVPDHPALYQVSYTMPPKPRSGRPGPSPKEAISPLLIYVEAREIREITAYNAGDINQCSGDPCISASGENICLALDKGLKRCAANFVPLGTRLWIEDVGSCLVTDRMHYRFGHRVDIAMSLKEKNKALEFGLKKLEVKILSHM